MPDLESIDASVDAVVNAGADVHVVFTVTHKGNWAVTEESTLGGILIKPWLSQPRALDDEGKPRYDVFNVILAEKVDSDGIKAGEVYPLLVDLNPPKST